MSDYKLSKRKRRQYAIQLATREGLSYKKAMNEAKRIPEVDNMNDFKFKLKRRLGVGYI